MEIQQKQRVVEVGKRLYKDFEINDNLKPIYSALHCYFHGQQGALDLNKGVALVGEFGLGKTTAFKVFHEYLKTYYPFNPNLFVVSSVEDLMNELNSSEWVNKKLTYNIDQSARGGNFKNPRHVLINEFGYMYAIKNYGTDVNQLIEAWIMKRYDIFQEFRKVTHITSNFSRMEISKNFHPKVVDRFKEMFNIITLEGKSLRK
jgi:DNA replication protein DnaC